MTTKGKKKGKTIPLTDFLASESKLVTVRPSTWSEIVDSEEAEVVPIVIDIGNLPIAPRSALDVDYSTISLSPPFIARISNLSFQADDHGLRNIFADLNPKSARVIRDNNQRSRGVGLVEFETRENLIEALKRSEKEFFGRSIRVDISDKTNMHAEGGRSGFGQNRSNRTGEERPEMADRWKRAEPRADDTAENRPGSGFNRDNRSNRGDYGRPTAGGSRDDKHGTDFGFGYPRPRDERSGGGSGSNREYNRQVPRNRYPDDGNRPNSRGDKPPYTGRYSDNRDTHERSRPSEETPEEPREAPREPPRERQRLQLQPRTKPLEEIQQLPSSPSSSANNAAQSSISNPEEFTSSVTNKSAQQGSSRPDDENQSNPNEFGKPNDNPSDEQPTAKPSRGAGASIFGGAKPVDTAARELEIERKMRELQMSNEAAADTEDKGNSSRQSYNRGGDRDGHRGKRSSQNDDNRSGHNIDYHHKREFSGGRQYEDEGRKPGDGQHRRGGGGGGGHDRDRYGGPSRRDHDSGRKGKYNHHNNSERDNERGNYRQREERTHDSNEFTSTGRSSNNNLNSETQSRNQQRGAARRTVPNEDPTHKLQLSNKFDMLGLEDPDDNNENDDIQSPTADD